LPWRLENPIEHELRCVGAAGLDEREVPMNAKRIAVATTGALLLVSGWLPVRTVTTTLAVGGVALVAGCSSGRSEARTEARTEARASERVEDRRD
jgi:hypothetical protein